MSSVRYEVVLAADIPLSVARPGEVPGESKCKSLSNTAHRLNSALKRGVRGVGSALRFINATNSNCNLLKNRLN
jgi:hypothetical protein